MPNIGMYIYVLYNILLYRNGTSNILRFFVIISKSTINVKAINQNLAVNKYEQGALFFFEKEN